MKKLLNFILFFCFSFSVEASILTNEKVISVLKECENYNEKLSYETLSSESLLRELLLIQDKKTIPGCINQIEVAINMLKDSIFVSSTNFALVLKKCFYK